MQYTEIDIKLKQIEPFTDILIAKFDQIDYESYSEHKNGLKAYIQTLLFNKEATLRIISNVAELTEISYKINKLEQKNWNIDWENNYSPVFINKNCVIRAHFHNSFQDIDHEIIITPKMSFGTGHHETTSLMMNEMFSLDFKDKSILDMGCGTGILAILASKLGAKDLLAIDSDEWAFINAKENASLNNISNIHFVHGNINSISNAKFDIILANINRNTIISDIDNYVANMNSSAILLLSGFLKEDVSLILEKTNQLGLKLVVLKNKNKWQMICLSSD